MFYLQKLSPEARKQEEAVHEKVLEERKHHEKVNHPGSKDQLEEVWKDEDHLDGTQFDPETFFNMRGAWIFYYYSIIIIISSSSIIATLSNYSKYFQFIDDFF